MIQVLYDYDTSLKSSR